MSEKHECPMCAELASAVRWAKDEYGNLLKRLQQAEKERDEARRFLELRTASEITDENAFRLLQDENARLREAYRALEFGMKEMAINQLDSPDCCASVEVAAKRIRYGASAALERAQSALNPKGTTSE